MRAVLVAGVAEAAALGIGGTLIWFARSQASTSPTSAVNNVHILSEFQRPRAVIWSPDGTRIAVVDDVPYSDTYSHTAAMIGVWDFTVSRLERKSDDRREKPSFLAGRRGVPGPPESRARWY